MRLTSFCRRKVFVTNQKLALIFFDLSRPMRARIGWTLEPASPSTPRLGLKVSITFIDGHQVFTRRDEALTTTSRLEDWAEACRRPDFSSFHHELMAQSDRNRTWRPLLCRGKSGQLSLRPSSLLSGSPSPLPGPPGLL